MALWRTHVGFAGVCNKARMVVDFTIYPLSGEPFKVDASDLAIGPGIWSRCSTKGIRGHSVARKVLRWWDGSYSFESMVRWSWTHFPLRGASRIDYICYRGLHSDTMAKDVKQLADHPMVPCSGCRQWHEKWHEKTQIVLSQLGGVFKDFYFNPVSLGKWSQFDEHIFQWGGERPPTSY